jgi:hypothetical protein
MKRLLVAFALLALTATPALAQDNPEPNKTITEYDFKDDVVTGKLKRPGDVIQGEPRAQSESLVTPRKNFVPELIKSVEQL